MKKSPLGFTAFILALIICAGILSIWLVSHFKLITYGKSFAAVIYEMVSGSVLMLFPVALILAIVAFIKDRFAIKSYSFMALVVILAGMALLFLA